MPERALAHRRRDARPDRTGTVCAARTPSRFSPAQASTIASYWPSRSLRSRVSTLPAHVVVHQVRPQRAQLRAPARRRRPDPRPGRQVGERRIALRAEGVARVFAPADGGERHVGGQRAREILARVNRVVGAALAQRELELLDEHVLARPPRSSGPGPRRRGSSPRAPSTAAPPSPVQPSPCAPASSRAGSRASRRRATRSSTGRRRPASRRRAPPRARPRPASSRRAPRCRARRSAASRAARCSGGTTACTRSRRAPSVGRGTGVARAELHAPARRGFAW